MATNAVVDPIKMPKMKVDNKFIAGVNAACTSLAVFFGWMAIFAGIASFTKEGWIVGLPLVDTIFGANFGGFYEGSVSIAFLATSILSLVFALIGLIAARKITDIDAMKSSWKCTRNVFVAIAGIEVLKMVILAIYALAGIGEKAGVKQGYLWLNGFLSNTLAAIGACAVAYIAHMIAQGKTQVLSIMRFVALGVAGAAFVIALISTFVNFYSGCAKDDYKCLYEEAKAKLKKD